MGMSWLHGEHMASQPPVQAVVAWVYLVVFGSLVAFNAYMVLLSRASAGLASSYTFVNPLIAMLLGVAVAGEHVSSFEWAAVGVVLAGVVLLLLQKR
jgi:drug/metabolite transporter (DMT)-like permease